MTLRDFIEKELGYKTVSREFYQKIAEWMEWYAGDVRSFHPYRVYNGRRHVQMRRDTLNMAKKVCEDWAGLLMNERVKISCECPVSQSFVERVFTENNMAVRLNEMQERKAASGTVAYIPRAVIDVDAETGAVVSGEIKIDCVDAPGIMPLSWEGGKITECAFVTPRVVSGRRYIYVQLHLLGSAGYVVSNRLFHSLDNGDINEVPDIHSVRGFENVAPEVCTGSFSRQFVIDRLNISNNVEDNNPMGISAFAGAVDVLRGIDLIYDSYNNEFLLGKKRIMVAAQAASFRDGNPVFDSNDTVFYQLPDDVAPDEGMIREIDMSLRSAEHETALQNRLILLSEKCGFGPGRYRFSRHEYSRVKTATEVISENSDLYRMLRKHEIVLRGAMTELVRIVLSLGRRVLGLPVSEETGVSIDFDDAVIEDAAELRRQAVEEFDRGLIDDVEYYVKAYGITEGEALRFKEKLSERRALPA